MSLVELPPTKPGDDLDGLLRAFFRSQMPHPWPAPRVSRFRTIPATRPVSGRSLIRSRWALAASVGLLVAGSLFLPGRFTQRINCGGNPAGPFISTNDRPWKHKESKNKEPKNKTKTGLRAEEAPSDGFDDLLDRLSPIK